jgi:AcrR family transcriptional regulator
MSLRKRKQRQQRAEIIANAIALFGERGVDEVRAADIASRCDISEATFFNYFGGKDALLREWAQDVLDEELTRVARRMGEGGTLRRAIRVAVEDVARRVASEPTLHSAAWTRLSVLHPDPATRGARGREEGPDPALDLVTQAQARGECRTDVDAWQLAALLRVVLVSSLAGSLDEAEGSVEARLSQACDLLLDGFRKRNERVPHTGAASQK